MIELPDCDSAAEQVDLFPVWSADGRELAYVGWMADQRMEVRIMDVATGAERVVYGPIGPDGNLFGLDWSADGST